MKAWLKHHLKGDPVIWGVVLLLSIVSILMVYSTTGSLAYRKMQGNTEYYLFKHTVLVLLSLVAMWVAHRIDYRYYAGISKIALWISAPLLFITWRYGVKLNEASRWLTLPGISKSFQPSDLGQLALITWLANWLAKRQTHIQASPPATIAPMLLGCSVISGLIALTNLSAGVLLWTTCLLLMYIGRIPSPTRWLFILISLLAGGTALLIGQRGGTALSRMTKFFNNDLPFQTEQAYIAIATGGLYGKGPGHSDQRNRLPHPYSDFIYAILIEEYGLLGGIILILLYIMLLYRGIRLLTTCPCYYGGLLSVGLSLLVVTQALLNMIVTVGLGPVTGLPLPLVSMGGTSLLFTGIAVGILLSVSRGNIDPQLAAIKKQEHAKGSANYYKSNA